MARRKIRKDVIKEREEIKENERQMLMIYITNKCNQ
jgi:thioredoxin-related protein